MPKSKNNPLTKVGDMVSVDLETGEQTPIESAGMRLLPPAPGLCQWCAVDHPPDQPHNQQSLYYQIKFEAIKGRPPTWSDAMAHCAPDVQELWREKLVEIMRKKCVEIPPDLKE